MGGLCLNKNQTLKNFVKSKLIKFFDEIKIKVRGFTLLHQATIDGFTVKDSIEKVKSKNNILIMVTTSAKIVIAIYSELGFVNDQGVNFKNNKDNAYILNLNTDEFECSMENTSRVNYHDKKYDVWFYSKKKEQNFGTESGLVLVDCSNANEDSFYKFNNTKTYFKSSEIEIYEIQI